MTEVNVNMASAAANAQVIIGNRGVLKHLDDSCFVDGVLQPMPAAFYAGIDRHALSAWCVVRGFYCLPTVELIDWLRERIGGTSAIEVACGHGAIGRALDIPITDSREHERPEMAAAIRAMGQGLTHYPPDVERATALQAIAKYKPHTVLAAWLTWRYDPRFHERGGSDHGVDWTELLLANACMQKLIFIGHERIHAPMSILELPHETHRLPFLWARPLDSLNAVWIWDRS